MKLSRSKFSLGKALFAITLLFGGLAHANGTWGGATNGNFATATNWGGNAVPTNNTGLTFTTATGGHTTTLTDDLFTTTFVVNGITYNGSSSYTINSNTAGTNGFTLSNAGIKNSSSVLQTINDSIVLASGAATINLNGTANAAGLTLGGTVSGSGGLNITGGNANTLTLGGIDTYTGATTVTVGTLKLTGEIGGGAGGGTAITTSGTATFNETGTGIIAGNSSLTITEGTSSLSGANTYTGVTTVNGATLKMDFSQAGAATSNILNSGNALSLGGSSVAFIGKAGVSNTQTLGAINLTSGLNNFSITSGDSTHGVGVTLGTITTTAGAMINFAAPTLGTNSLTNGYSTTNTTINGILGTWAVFNGNDWATNTGAGTLITAYTGYTNINALGSTIASDTTANLKINASGTGGDDSLAAGGVTSINSLVQGTSTASTIDIGSGNTLNFGTNGGILVGTSAGSTGSLTLGATVDDGTITAGGAILNTSGTLSLINLSTAGLTVNSVITDNGTGATSVITNGSVTFNGDNIYTGTTTIGSGTLTIGGTGTLDSGDYANAIVNNGVFNYDSSASQTLSGVLSGAGVFSQNGTGTLIITGGSNTYTGGFSVGGGTLQLGDSGVYSTTNYDLVFTGNGSVTAGGTSGTLTLTSIANGSTPPALGGAIQIASGVTGTIGAGLTIVMPTGGQGGFISPLNSTGAGGTLDIYGALSDAGLLAVNNSTVVIESGGSVTALNYYMMTYNLNTDLVPANTIVMGGGSLTATGTISLNTGQVLTGSQNYDLLTVGGGPGTARVTAPALVLASFGNGAKYGRLVLNTGGLITTGYVGIGSTFTNVAGDIFYLNGGTLQASASSTGFIANLGATYVGGDNGSGGSTIDNAGHNITITQALLTGVGSGDTLSSAFSSTTDGGLTFTDSGANATTTLTGSNTYNGGTTITGGTLLAANASALGNKSGSLAINGDGILDIDNINQQVGATTLGLVGASKGGKIQSTGGTKTLTTSGVTVNGLGNIIDSSIILVGNTILSSGAALEDDGAITGTIGIGDGTLSGSGSVSGAATLNGGTINFANGASLNSTLNVTGGNWNGLGSVAGLVTSSSGTFTFGSGANLTATSGLDVTGGTISGSGTITGNLSYTSGTDSTFGGVVAGAGSTLTLDSAGTILDLTGINTYGGGTIITAGILEVTGAGTVGASTSGMTVNGTFDLEGTTQQVGALNGAGTITNLALTGNTADSGLVIGNGNASGSYSGSIQDGILTGSGGDTISVKKVGTGTEILSGANEYSGSTASTGPTVGIATEIDGGILQITDETNIGNADGYFASIGYTPKIELGGGELLTTGATATMTEGVILKEGTTNTLAAAASTTATYNGVIADNTISGALTVGDGLGHNGTVALTGTTNTYSGGTHVMSGTLLVNNTSGSATGSGALQVDSSATLAGTGQINSTTNTINGHVLVGQNSLTDVNTTNVLHMTASASTTFSGANLTFNLSATNGTSNSLDLGSTASVSFSNSTLTFNLQGGTTISDETFYTLFTDTAGSSAYGDISGLTLVFDINGVATNTYDGSILVVNGNNLELEVMAGSVPEPGAWALMLGGFAFLILIQYRRRNRGQV